MDLLTLAEVAILLRYTGKTAALRVKALTEREGLPYIQRGRSRLIPREGLEQWLDAQIRKHKPIEDEPKTFPATLPGRWDGKWR